VAARAEGLGIRAGARGCAVDPPTVRPWVVEAAAFSPYGLHDRRIRQVPRDDLLALGRAVQASQARAGAAMARLSRAPHGVWGAIDPGSPRLLASAVGDRTLTMAPSLVHRVWEGLAPGGLPVLRTDGVKASPTALLTHGGPWVQPPRRQATGPAPTPRGMPLPALLSAQVGQPSRRRRVVRVCPRVVCGTRAEGTPVWAAPSWPSNTAFRARAKGALRQPVAASGRRVITRGTSAAG
jgi:hypothetical protein